MVAGVMAVELSGCHKWYWCWYDYALRDVDDVVGQVLFNDIVHRPREQRAGNKPDYNLEMSENP